MSERSPGAIMLGQCEAVISEGLESLEKVRWALPSIEEMKLYP